ncbi:hypothetical protein N7493_002043 [Penicillium malachiteum]|uniref:Uncharacterized protein n=1 Tax=Penicillium malachiteum TaxID=1324776 RepID=A0AAD6N0I3_9EURO|nr:hypothetical protein N7493_002043 [Penicillium malachiteum]
MIELEEIRSSTQKEWSAAGETADEALELERNDDKGFEDADELDAIGLADTKGLLDQTELLGTTGELDEA